MCLCCFGESARLFWLMCDMQSVCASEKLKHFLLFPRLTLPLPAYYRNMISTVVYRRSASIGSWLFVAALVAAGLLLFAQLCRVGIVSGLLLLLFAFYQWDLIVHTVYQYQGGISSSDAYDAMLIIQRGRWGRPRRIVLSDIVDVCHERRLCGLWCYVLLTLRDGSMVTLEPSCPKELMVLMEMELSDERDDDGVLLH